MARAYGAKVFSHASLFPLHAKYAEDPNPLVAALATRFLKAIAPFRAQMVLVQPYILRAAHVRANVRAQKFEAAMVSFGEMSSKLEANKVLGSLVSDHTEILRACADILREQREAIQKRNAPLSRCVKPEEPEPKKSGGKRGGKRARV